MNKKFYRYKRFWLLLLTATYLLFGFFYVPTIIKQQLQEQVSLQLEMQANMENVKFNPLTFNIKITDLQLTDANQETWYHSQSTGINFDPLNLIWGQWKFSDLNLVGPEITLTTNEAGQVIIPALPEFPANETNVSPFELSIDNIQMKQGRMQLQADNIKEDFALNFIDIEINHKKFSMADEDTPFNLTIITEFNEILALQGQYNQSQQHIKSQIELKDWQATTLNKFLPDDLNLNNQYGTLQANGDIDWVLNQKPVVNFSNIEMAALQSNWHDQIKLNDLHVNITSAQIDIEAQTILIETIHSDHGQWQVLWPINLPTDNDVGYAANTALNQTTDTHQAPWQIDIQQINVKEWPVTLQDNDVQAELTFTIQSLNVATANNRSKPFQINSLINFSEGGSITINSEQSLSPVNLISNIEITDLFIPQLAPWITDVSGLVFTQGTLQSTQQLSLTEQHFDLNGRLLLYNTIIDNQAGQNITTMSQLMVGESTISSQSKTIVLDQITLDQAFGNLINATEQSINIQNLKIIDETEQTRVDKQNIDWVIKLGSINSNTP